MKSFRFILGSLLFLLLNSGSTFAQEFTLTTTAANTVSSKSSIDMPGLTGNALAIIVATPIGSTAELNPNPIGAWYYSGKWNIFNSNHSVMPLGAKYKVQFFKQRGPNQFLHVVTEQNLGAEGSYIDSPALNDNPNAQVQILQNHAPDDRSPYNLNRFAAKASYSSAAGRWYIANTNDEPLRKSTAYNVVVSPGGVGANTNPPVGMPGQANPTPTGPTPASVGDPVVPAGTNANPPVIKGTPKTPTPISPGAAPTSPNPNPPVIKAIPKNPTPIQPEPTPIPVPTPIRLNGFVDMHTHPMSHLGFGKKLLHGVPDGSVGPDNKPNGSIVPAGTRSCNAQEFRASNIFDALGNCSSTHGGWGLGYNECGDSVRATIISELFDADFASKLKNDLFNGGNLIGDHRHEGIDSVPQQFLYWPHQTSKVHQQMWWEWIKRAKEQGNLRVMVALAVNSELLAEIINGGSPRDDKSSADLQIDEIKSFVGRHNDFMEVAYAAADVRRIVGAGKLAVILGVEVDNIGNFNKQSVPPFDYAPSPPSDAAVRAEIQRLYAKGVRYVFPIHLLDNQFGGTAVYEDLFNFANKYSTGKFYTVRQSNAVGFKLGEMSDIGVYLSSNKDIGRILDGLALIPYKPAFNANPLDSRFCINALPFHGSLGCWTTFRTIRTLLTPPVEWQIYDSIPKGHLNAKGLSNAGKVAVKEMMKLGMLIDIDHMSDLAQDDTLTMAERFQYPVNIGHNGIRHANSVERHASISATQRVAALGGIFGVGTADSEEHHTDASTFIASFNEVWATSSAKGSAPRVAMGTDVNGMERLPRAPKTHSVNFYNSEFPRSTTGSRTWDYTVEGVSQYGLMADFMKDVREKNLSVHQRLMDSAEYFAQMWEKAEKQKASVQ